MGWGGGGGGQKEKEKKGSPVATLPGAWHYKESSGAGWSGVSIL